MSTRVCRGQVRNVGGRKLVALSRNRRGEWVVGYADEDIIYQRETRGDLSRWPVVGRVQLREVGDWARIVR